MPLAWIHDLPKQQLEELAGQLGLSVDGALDDLRKRVKEKWTAVEHYLPPAKFVKTSQSPKLVQPGIEPSISVRDPATKVKIKLVSDLISGIPVLSGTDPEDILKFLIRVNEVGQLNLVSNSEFMALLIGRTSGRIMQILGAHLGTTDSWGMVQSEIISTFLPPRVSERFLVSYVLERFQAPDEDLNSYIMSVVAAAGILGFPGSESQLVRRILQNLHPRARSYCLFESRPESVRDLFSLATTVAEAVAVEDQRKRLTSPIQQGGAPQARSNGMFKKKVVPARVDRTTKCWQCGVFGHVRRACPAGRSEDSNLSRSGNGNGAR
jgi:hypothetical protein